MSVGYVVRLYFKESRKERGKTERNVLFQEVLILISPHLA